MRNGWSVRAASPPSAADPAKVTVVVPCYNYGRFLTDAVGSALSQRGVEVDVVIVDDASTDDSRTAAEQLVSSDSRVRLVAHARNLGHVETFNEALGYATGEFIVKLDADDLLAPGSLSRSTALMRAHPEVVFCYGHPLEFRGVPPEIEPGTPRSWSIWDGVAWTRSVLHRGHNVIMQPEVLLRRTAVEATGGYRPQLRWGEDYNWWLRLAATGSVGRVNGVVQGLYRVHDGSLQRSAVDLELSDLEARLAAVNLFFAEREDSLNRNDGLRDIAYSSLLRDARSLVARAHERTEPARQAIGAFEAIASSIEGSVGRRVVRGPSASPTAFGRLFRDLEWRLKWRRWRRWGL